MFFLSACYIFSFGIRIDHGCRLCQCCMTGLLFYFHTFALGVCLRYVCLHIFSRSCFTFVHPLLFQIVIPHGEPVTIDTFLVWRERFEAELALERAK
jgi:hypothetical protein